MRGLVITIDGPGGTGKSTTARGLAKRLGYLYLDTGAMYRAVALEALRNKVPVTDRKALSLLARRCRIGFRVDPGHRLKVLLNGKDVTEAIRDPEVTQTASVVATVPAVRQALVREQRALGARGRIVAEGRDTGTAVFPKADLKVFLTATVTERARRRWRDLKRMGESVAFPEVLRDLRRRDLRDRRREASPLRIAPGALRVDNTRLQSSQVVDKLLDYVRRIDRNQRRGGSHVF